MAAPCGCRSWYHSLSVLSTVFARLHSVLALWGRSLCKFVCILCHCLHVCTQCLHFGVAVCASFIGMLFHCLHVCTLLALWGRSLRGSVCTLCHCCSLCESVYTLFHCLYVWIVWLQFVSMGHPNMITTADVRWVWKLRQVCLSCEMLCFFTCKCECVYVCVHGHDCWRKVRQGAASSLLVVWNALPFLIWACVFHVWACIFVYVCVHSLVRLCMYICIIHVCVCLHSRRSTAQIQYSLKMGRSANTAVVWEGKY